MQARPSITAADYLAPRSLSLPALLRSHDAFVLPPTQRVYGWQEDHVTRWLADASIRALSPEAADILPSWFFLGTVYLAGAPGMPMSIADGQQRLVTGTMFYAVARDLEPDPERKARLAACIVNADGAFRLTLRDIDAGFFRTWVQEDGATLKVFRMEEDESGDAVVLSDSQSNLINNRNLFVEGLRALGPERRRELLDYMETRSVLIAITAATLGEALAAYASTHKRGLRQAETDKFKSEIIGDAPANDRHELGNLWDECEASLGKDALEELLQMIVIAKSGALPSADLQSSLMMTFDLPREATAFIPGRLVPSALAFAQIQSGGAAIGEYVSRRAFDAGRIRRLQSHLIALNRVSPFSHAEWKAPVLVALETLKGDVGLLDQVLAGIERMASIFMIAGHEPHDCGKRYAALARAIETRQAPTINAALTVDAQLKRKARDQLVSSNFGQKQRCRTPVLLKLNDLIRGEVVAINPSDVSCEHILPQNVDRSNIEWYRVFRGERDRYNGQHFRNRIGNLTILSHPDNRRAAARPFAQKRPILQGSTFDLSRHAAKEAEWTSAVIEARSEALVAMLVAHWQL